MFGEDFAKARTHWLYPREPQQHLWRSLGIFVVLFGIYYLAQVVAAMVVYHFYFGGDFASLQGLMQGGTDATLSPDAIMLAKSMVVGIFPAGLPIAIAALYFSHFGLPKRLGRLPMEWPKISIFGWILILVCFVIFMGIAANVIFAALGIDASTYETTAKGLSDTKSNAGAVEKSMAELAQDPILFVLAMPGVLIAAPLVEEILCRGVLFAGIAQTRLGWVGAVIITSAVWAVLHAGAAPWLFVGILFVMGLVLGVLLLRFGSLWVTIACHTAWNALFTLTVFSLGTHT